MDRDERPRFRDLAGDWLLEASVLVVVFPVVDQVVGPDPFRWGVAGCSFGVALIAFWLGVYLKLREVR